MAEKKEKLFSQFAPVDYATWRAKVEADLKGAPFDKKLVWRTNEGFNVQPIYRREDIAGFKTLDSLPGEYPYVRGTRCDNNWLTRQEILSADPAEANRTALEVLGKGVTSLGFTLAEPSEASLKALLEGIDLAKVEVNITCCPTKALALAKMLVAYLQEKGVADTFRGAINYDPLRKAMRRGTPVDTAAIAAEAKEMLQVVEPVKGLRCLAVDSVELSNAGAFIYEELGYALAWGAQWMTLLTEAGCEATKVACRIKFNMGVSSNFFMEIAKFRAARMLWAQIVKEYNPACPCATKMVVNAATSKYNQTLYDAHVNLLRSQTEAFSAAVAGVDSITSVPFDTPYKTPDAFSERIARNQQLLLKEESHMDKVLDPAGGSYYVETLTISLAQQAWKLFLGIVDDKGGFFEAVSKGDIQRAVAEANTRRHTDVARRKEILLGTNQYPNINEKALDKIEGPLTEKYALEGCSCTAQAPVEGDTLPDQRLASQFEQLRLATEKASHRPRVFMLTIGNLAMRLARAQYSSNFFGCAGYEIIDNLGFKTVDEGVAAAVDKKADVVVLCSSDEEYATLAPEAFKALGGRALFVVAGNPECADALRAQGITDFIHVRVNVLDTLRDFNTRLLK